MPVAKCLTVAIREGALNSYQFVTQFDVLCRPHTRTMMYCAPLMPCSAAQPVQGAQVPTYLQIDLRTHTTSARRFGAQHVEVSS
eukprot:4558985-Amphidinium_carterae.1